MPLTQADLNAAQADILAKVNDRFAALGKLVSPDPVPVPPPPPGPPVTYDIRFAVHRYWLGGPIEQADVYDLQAGQYLDLSKFPTSSAKYRYVSTARVLNDTAGDTQFAVPSMLAGLVMVDSSGRPISRDNGNDQLLNLASPMLRSLIVQNLPVMLKGFDGLYIDEVDKTWLYGYPGTAPAGLTEASWQYQMVDFVTAVTGAVRALGKRVWVNLGGNQLTEWAFVSNVIKAVDAVNIEYFVGREKLGKTPATGSDYQQIVQLLDLIERTYSKPCHVHVSTTSQAVTDQGFLAWLLGTQFRGSFTASLDYGGDTLRPSATLLSQARKLNGPLENYAIVNGVYTRKFNNGSVTSTGITLGGNSA